MNRITPLALGGATILAALFRSPSPPTHPAPKIEQVATLRTARSAHTATTLPSGQVLVAGGMATGGGSVASVELFDPATNTVRELGSLAESRSGHTATLLADGRVLIAGGYNGQYTSSVEVYDPRIGRFRPGGSLVEARSGQTATLLTNGRILFVGGVGPGWTFLRTAEVYDPDTGRSVAVGSMSVPRESHTASLLGDGRVLVVGGHNGRRQAMEVFAGAEIFSPTSRRFEPAGRLGISRHKHDAVRLADGRVLVIGGADRSDRVFFATTEVYVPRTGRFEPGPPMASTRYKIAGTSVLLPDGDVLVTSGARSAELLDVERWAFTTVSGTFPEPYNFAATALLSGGDVLISGGYGQGVRSTAGVWRFRRD